MLQGKYKNTYFFYVQNLTLSIKKYILYIIMYKKVYFYYF